MAYKSAAAPRSFGIISDCGSTTRTWFAAAALSTVPAGTSARLRSLPSRPGTGKVLWHDRAFAKASIVLADSTAFVVDDDGTVALASISPNGMRVLGEAQLLRANAWTVPILAESRLYVRDRHRIIALELQPRRRR